MKQSPERCVLTKIDQSGGLVLLLNVAANGLAASKKLKGNTCLQLRKVIFKYYTHKLKLLKLEL